MGLIYVTIVVVLLALGYEPVRTLYQGYVERQRRLKEMYDRWRMP